MLSICTKNSSEQTCPTPQIASTVVLIILIATIIFAAKSNYSITSKCWIIGIPVITTVILTALGVIYYTGRSKRIKT